MNLPNMKIHNLPAKPNPLEDQVVEYMNGEGNRGRIPPELRNGGYKKLGVQPGSLGIKPPEPRMAIPAPPAPRRRQ